jgi:hypothetical protein
MVLRRVWGKKQRPRSNGQEATAKKQRPRSNGQEATAKKQRPRSNGQEATAMTADQRQWLDLSP